MVWMWVLAHKFRVEDTKNGLQREILSFVLTFTRIFCPGTILYSRLRGGAQVVFWGRTFPEMHSDGTGPVTFFWGTILAWEEADFSLGWHKQ